MVDGRRFKLILLETPKSLVVGFDNLSLKAGELFKGIKDIPIGAHFLHTSLNLGRSSSFVHFEVVETLVFRWEAQVEEFCKVSGEEEEVYAASVNEFLPMMVAYPEESLRLWRDLTSYITRPVVSKLEPVSSNILSADKESSGVSIDHYDHQAFVKNNQATPVDIKLSRSMSYYTSIPKWYTKSHMSPAEITQFNHDKSFLLYQLLCTEYSSAENMLGEFQFAFVSFLLGENPDSFDQWKAILVLLCNCEAALKDRKDLFAKFIPVLYSQIKSLPKDLVVDPLLGTSFVTSSIKSFMSLLDNEELDQVIKSRGSKLRKMLMEELNIVEFEMIDDEDAPIIVNE